MGVKAPVGQAEETDHGFGPQKTRVQMPPGVAVFYHAVKVIDVFKTKISFLIILNAV